MAISETSFDGSNEVESSWFDPIREAESWEAVRLRFDVVTIVLNKDIIAYVCYGYS